MIYLLPSLGLVGALPRAKHAVLQAEHLGVVRLDLAQLVHELELVDADVTGTIARSLKIRRDNEKRIAFDWVHFLLTRCLPSGDILMHLTPLRWSNTAVSCE